VDYAGTFDTNFLTIDPNGEDIQGGTDNLVLRGEREGVVLIYVDSTQGWLPISGINEGTDALEPDNLFSRFFSSSWRRCWRNWRRFRTSWRRRCRRLSYIYSISCTCNSNYSNSRRWWCFRSI
jgi:hypothetical protein